MRPHRALFHLVLRHTVWKVLLLLLLLAAVCGLSACGKKEAAQEVSPRTRPP